MAAQVPNIFVEQYDQGQKKIRADLMDENFAYVCQQIDANASSAQDAAAAAQSAADAAQATADGKASPDLDNVTPAGTEVIAHAAMPSSQTVDLSLPQSSGTVTAPADGYIMLQASGNGTNTCNMFLYGRIKVRQFWPGGVLHMFLPVSKDEVVAVGYVNITDTPVLRFAYANGSAPTA